MQIQPYLSLETRCAAAVPGGPHSLPRRRWP